MVILMDTDDQDFVTKIFVVNLGWNIVNKFFYGQESGWVTYKDGVVSLY